MTKTRLTTIGWIAVGLGVADLLWLLCVMGTSIAWVVAPTAWQERASEMLFIWFIILGFATGFFLTATIPGELTKKEMIG